MSRSNTMAQLEWFGERWGTHKFGEPWMFNHHAFSHWSGAIVLERGMTGSRFIYRHGSVGPPLRNRLRVNRSNAVRQSNSCRHSSIGRQSVDGQLGAAQDLSSEINRDARLLCRLLFFIRSIVRPKTCYKEWCPRLWNALLAVVSVEINCTAQNLLQKMSRDAR